MNGETWDYVIVGAGTAGCVLAHRLSADRHTRVLLPEPGRRHATPPTSIPIGLGKLHQYRLHDWGFDTEPEAALGGRRLEAMRGKVLGGCSSINVMAWTRGHPGDFDRWVAQGATGWSYAEVLPYFRRTERWEGGADRYRGGDGPIGAEFSRSTDPVFDAWQAAARQAGLPVTADYNGAQPEGFGRGQYSIRDGRRSSASIAYLRPVMNRPNLVVRTGAHAHRIVFDGRKALGIDYDAGGMRRALATREVIIAAGAFNTPHLLMLSGIGPADHLRAHGIAPLVDAPRVGANLQDHLGTWITWRRRTPGAFHRTMRFDRMSVAMLRAYLFGEGPASTVPGGLHAFIRTRPELATPDIEFMFHTVPPQTRLWFPMVRPAYADGYAIRPTLLHPQSRGRLQLRSDDPRAPIRIRYDFFSHPDDLPRLREGFRLARHVGEQAAMNEYRDIELAPGPDVKTDDGIDDYIRRTALTAHHPCGTCAMGSDAGSVLDPELRVRGVRSLRVVDASAMPDLVSAHLNAAVFMMAEKAADLIRGKVAG